MFFTKMVPKKSRIVKWERVFPLGLKKRLQRDRKTD